MAALDNARHEKFAQGLAAGLSQRKAYRAAFPNSERWKDSTVDKRASELYAKGEILGRLRELGQQSTTKAVMSISERKEWLTDIMQSEVEETKDKLKACDILNRMDGAYIDKLEVNGQLNSNPFAGMSTEDLKALVDGG